jgi:hypothetical protein
MQPPSRTSVNRENPMSPESPLYENTRMYARVKPVSKQ